MNISERIINLCEEEDPRLEGLKADLEQLKMDLSYAQQNDDLDDRDNVIFRIKREILDKQKQIADMKKETNA